MFKTAALFATTLIVAAMSAGESEARVRQALPDTTELAALPADGGPEFNRLVFQTSPYLRQHARNPVNWYPWGPEALALAAAENRPIFLSVGYSTCHWCHVMEHESFENDEVAAILNANYVCIKVDREERPDLDAIYMSATQLFTGRGGWPNSLWLTPEGKPWFAGTYFPRDDRGGRPGFKTLLLQLREVWDTRRADVDAQAEQIVQAIAQYGVLPPGGGALDRSPIEGALTLMADRFDPAAGGFGDAPKFPPHQALALLLHEYRRQADPELLAMIEQTLEAMARGGIHDQIGGGFHRYSTDAHWFLPHFEKMLYDNAMLLPIYAEAASITGRDDFAAVARGIATWALRDMRDAGGAFHSALDADSEGEEGKFYLWSEAQLAEQLGVEAAEIFGRIHGAVDGGNYHEEATGERPGTNILHLPRSLVEAVAEEGVSLASTLEQRERLRAHRDGNRIWPEKDDKVLTAWNGLMIAGLAQAGRLLEEPAWIAAAGEAADFLLDTMLRDGRLLRSYRAGEAALPAYLDDYAGLAFGLLALHEATGRADRLAQAESLMATLVEHHWDEAGAGFFFTADDHEQLLHRSKDPYDSALPSGNGIALQVLLDLPGASHADRLRRALESFQPVMARSSQGAGSLLLALSRYLDLAPSTLPVLPGAEGSAEASAAAPPLRAELYLGAIAASPSEEIPILLRLVIDEGWHLNSAAPGDSGLIATRLSLAGEGFLLDPPDYPMGESLSVPFSPAPISVYSGELLLAAKLRVAADASSGRRSLDLILDYQACDEGRCLPPATLSLSIELEIGEGSAGTPRHSGLFLERR
jgi:uncharacterized protein